MWHIRLAESLRTLINGSDKKKAHELFSRIDDLERELLSETLEVFRKDMECLEKGRGKKLLVGEGRGWQREKFKAWISVDSFFSGHWWICGGTGSGKTYWTLSILLQLLTLGHSPLLIIDYKGELASLLTETWLPAFLANANEEQRDWLLKRLVIINPFHSQYLPEFQILKRDPDIPIQMQAHEVASIFEKTIENDLGIRQDTIMKFVLMLSIEQGLTFMQAKELLENPFFLEALVRRSKLKEVRNYFTLRFKREAASSVISLTSRFDNFLMLPQTRLMLSASGTVNFDQLLQDKITIVNLGSPPYGSSGMARFWGTLIFVKLSRAIFNRHVDTDTPPIWVCVDEWQELLTREQATEMERILALARFKKVCLTLVNQQAVQVAKVSSPLVEIVKTNTNYQVFFRSSFDDARHFSHALPVTGRRLKAKQNRWDPEEKEGFYSAAEELRLLEQEMSQLPDRWFYYFDKRKPYLAQLVRSPHLDLTQAAKLGRRVAEDTKERLGRGLLGVPIALLKQAEEAREEEIRNIQKEATGGGSVALAGEISSGRDEEGADLSVQRTIPISKQRTAKSRTTLLDLG